MTRSRMVVILFAAILALAVRSVWQVTPPAAAQIPPTDTPTSTPTPVVLVDYRSSGWSYRQVANAGGPLLTPIVTPSYPWTNTNATAGFGSANASDCPLYQVPGNIATHWDPLTDIWIYRTFSVPAGIRGFKVAAIVDNDIQVWINGQDVSNNLRGSVGCAWYANLVFAIPDSGVLNDGSNNSILVLGRDVGRVNILDVQITNAGLATNAGTPVPTITPTATPTTTPTPTSTPTATPTPTPCGGTGGVPMTPTPTSLVLWLKADAICATDQSRVALWPDRSGKGYDAKQLTSTNQPSFVASAVNGKPVVRFDGTGPQFLLVDDQNDLDLTGDQTVFVVVFRTSAATTSREAILDHYDTNSPWTGWGFETNAGAASHWASGTGQWLQGRPVISDGTVHVGEVVRQSGTATLFHDGSVTASRTSDTNGASTGPLTIGSYNNSGAIPFSGDIAEIIVYKSALSLTDRQMVEGYLATKYAVCGGVGGVPAKYGDLALWLKADALCSGQSSVGAWPDRSGYAYQVVQTSSGNQPSLVTNSMNGQPVVRFNGVRPDYLHGDAGAPTSTPVGPRTNNDLDDNNLQLTGDQSIFVVLRTTSSSPPRMALVDHYDASRSPYTGWGVEVNPNGPAGTPVSLAYWTNGAGQWAQGSTGIGDAQAHVGEVIRQSGTAYLYQDGTQTTSHTSETNGSTASPLTIGVYTGNGGPFSGDIAEIIVYSRALTGTERADIESYLRTKYGTP